MIPPCVDDLISIFNAHKIKIARGSSLKYSGCNYKLVPTRYVILGSNNKILYKINFVLDELFMREGRSDLLACEEFLT